MQPHHCHNKRRHNIYLHTSSKLVVKMKIEVDLRINEVATALLREEKKLQMVAARAPLIEPTYPLNKKKPPYTRDATSPNMTCIKVPYLVNVGSLCREEKKPEAGDLKSVVPYICTPAPLLHHELRCYDPPEVGSSSAGGIHDQGAEENFTEEPNVTLVSTPQKDTRPPHNLAIAVIAPPRPETRLE
ncbi:hypothetical protein Cgig2_026432 [Carnegiea gigantea]|uniref:Uncharacterized protein n=1 Tax=Carnegiea gigantea TaxID=171969 RepID=A0A9Q1KQ81_9CARY|nr:hypothetical protein Cgig2_026432 [Carnegiea gigantea]